MKATATATSIAGDFIASAEYENDTDELSAIDVASIAISDLQEILEEKHNDIWDVINVSILK